VLKKLLYKPLLDFLDKRSREVSTNIKETEKLREETKQLMQDQHQKLSQAKHEALEIIKRAKQFGSNESNRIIDEAKNKASTIIENTKSKIDIEIQKQKENLLHEVGDISVKLTERIIKRELQSSDIDRIAEDFIKELKEIK